MILWALPIVMAAWLMILLTGMAALAAEPKNLLIVFDFSHSMSRDLGGMPKIDLARLAFSEVMQGIDPQTKVGLRIFAQGQSGARAKDCKSSALPVPLGGKRSAIVDAVNNNQPVGHKTPITYALGLAMKDLEGVAGDRKIILISDGQETCGGDPEELAEVLLGKGISVDAIGLGQAADLAQLGGIALAGGGKFRLGSNLQSLKGALQLAMGSGSGMAPGGAGGRALPQAMGGGRLGPVQGGGTGTPKALPQAPPQAGPKTAPPQAPAAPAASSLVRVVPLTPGKPSAKPANPPKPKPQPAPVMSLELILDASGSMAAAMGKKTKMALAKQALEKTVHSLESDLIRLAFRAYGFDASLAKTAEASCPNTELLVPFGQGGASAILKAAGKLHAYGYTPLARSLTLAGRDLAPFKDSERTIVLISDGKETCGGDPVAAIKALRKMGIKVQVHVIGFDLDKQSRAQLVAVAKAGGGRYFDAANYDGLIQSLKIIIGSVQGRLAQLAPDRFIKPVSGGADIKAAVTLGPGRYTLADNVLKGQAAFFRVDTTKAQYAGLRGRIQAGRLIKDKGEKGKLAEAKSAAGGFTLRVYDARGKEIKTRRRLIRGEVGSEGVTGFVDTTGKGFYFSVGDDYNNVHKDAMFELIVLTAGDVLPGQEAPAKPGAGAVELPPAQEANAHLGLDDKADAFIVRIGKGAQPPPPPAPAGAKGLDLKPSPPPKPGPARLVIHFDDPQFRFKVEVFDANGRKRAGRFVKLRGKAELEIPLIYGGGAFQFRIKDNNPSLYNLFSGYRLKVTAPQ